MEEQNTDKKQYNPEEFHRRAESYGRSRALEMAKNRKSAYEELYCEFLWEE